MNVVKVIASIPKKVVEDFSGLVKLMERGTTQICAGFSPVKPDSSFHTPGHDGRER